MIIEENMKTRFLIIWCHASNILKHRIQAQDNFKEWTVQKTLWDYWHHSGMKLLISNPRRTTPNHFKRPYDNYTWSAMEKQICASIHGPIWQWYESHPTHWRQVVNLSHSSWCRPEGKRPRSQEGTSADIATMEESATEWQMTMGLILGSDCLRFGKLIEDLKQNTQGMKSFTQTLYSAFVLLNNSKSNQRNLQRHNMNEGVAFATKGSTTNKGNLSKGKKQGPHHMLQVQQDLSLFQWVYKGYRAG